MNKHWNADCKEIDFNDAFDDEVEKVKAQPIFNSFKISDSLKILVMLLIKHSNNYSISFMDNSEIINFQRDTTKCIIYPHITVEEVFLSIILIN